MRRKKQDKRHKRRQKQKERSKVKKKKRAQNQPQTAKKRRVSDEAIYEAILDMTHAAGPEKSVSPPEIARALREADWQALLKRIRITAKKLALAGQIEILRKGRPVDPNDFKGVIRLRAVPEAAQDAAGREQG